MSAEQIQALADAVAMWQMQEVSNFFYVDACGELMSIGSTYAVRSVEFERISQLTIREYLVAFYCLYVSPHGWD
jgi:hypothetical protein